MIKINFNEKQKKLEFEKPDFQSDLYLKNSLGCRPSYGQAVADCDQGAYTSYGWVSVWASIQSAFLPYTAVAIAGACAISEYPTGEECYEIF